MARRRVRRRRTLGVRRRRYRRVSGRRRLYKRRRTSSFRKIRRRFGAPKDTLVYKGYIMPSTFFTRHKFCDTFRLTVGHIDYDFPTESPLETVPSAGPAMLLLQNDPVSPYVGVSSTTVNAYGPTQMASLYSKMLVYGMKVTCTFSTSNYRQISAPNGTATTSTALPTDHIPVIAWMLPQFENVNNPGSDQFLPNISAWGNPILSKLPQFLNARQNFMELKGIKRKIIGNYGATNRVSISGYYSLNKVYQQGIGQVLDFVKNPPATLSNQGTDWLGGDAPLRMRVLVGMTPYPDPGQATGGVYPLIDIHGTVTVKYYIKYSGFLNVNSTIVI